MMILSIVSNFSSNKAIMQYTIVRGYIVSWDQYPTWDGTREPF